VGVSSRLDEGRSTFIISHALDGQFRGEPMHADIRGPLRSRGPFWLDGVILAFSIMTVIWVAFVR
jgi:hypothetical protein